MKLRPVGAEVFRADGRTDGQTDTIKLIVCFRNFVKATIMKSGVQCHSAFTSGRSVYLISTCIPYNKTN